MEQRTTTVLDVAARLLRDVADDVPPLGAVAAALGELADGLGVDRVVVALDHPQFGRQLFCSGRRPLGRSTAGLSGPAGVSTEPALPIEVRAEAVLISVVRAALGRAVERSRSQDPRRQRRRAELRATVGTATAAALRYGWHFSLAFIEIDPDAEVAGAPAARSLRAGTRAGDRVVDLGGGRFAVVIQAAAGDHVPPILARVARQADLPPFSFGLVCCPADGTDAETLVERGLDRLQTAKRAKTSGTVSIRAYGNS